MEALNVGALNVSICSILRKSLTDKWCLVNIIIIIMNITVTELYKWYAHKEGNWRENYSLCFSSKIKIRDISPPSHRQYSSYIDKLIEVHLIL